MKYMTVNELRERFLSFFEEKDHLRLKSFSLIPENDKSLLLINAGMAPLKPFFTGLETPPSKRVTTCQKCIRTGDIDNVGITARHCTFFEMLGNFSFGNYFKEEIIPWSWEFCTKVLEIPEEKLNVSVYYEDEEAFHIWHEKIGLPKEKIFKMGKEDNFWEVGTGPCGPCSEIYFDRGEEYGCKKEGCTVGCDCDRFMEIWNLVFTQFNKEEDGTYTPLSYPNIDTGMGLERLAVAMQNVVSVFDIDSIKAVREAVCKKAGVVYGENKNKDISIRIVTDHIRSVTFMLADGVLPNNEGRGYVLRRLLRRAARHGKLLGINDMFLSKICETVIEESKGAYPELLEKKDYILKILSVEESKFYETLDQGLAFVKEYIKQIKADAKDIFSGIAAFKLYDTFGFPVELMREILSEENLKLDFSEFEQEMEKQRQLSRSSRGENTFMGGADDVYTKLDPNETTEFIGYDFLETDNGVVKAIILENEIVESAEKGNEISVILDKTPFYATSGGQRGDIGVIECSTGKLQVNDCIKVSGNKFAHLCIVTEGEIAVNTTVKAAVNKAYRMDTARNHTATHLLQKALREVLGTHVEQAGSYVSADRLRFDFTHFESLTQEQLIEIEEMVNHKIFESINTEIIHTDLESAKKMGAMALFGEKYGKDVRVIKINDFSTELCGGTHVKNTAQISTFKILSESGISAGVRRIEALTGRSALEFYKTQDKMLKLVAGMFKSSTDNILKRAEGFMMESKIMKNEIERLKRSMSGNIVDDLIKDKLEIKGMSAVIGDAGKMDMNSLRDLGDKVRDRIGSSVIVLASENEEKANLIVMVSQEFTKEGFHAGNIIKEIAPVIEGKGGGKPNMAQAGGKDPSKIKELVEKAKELIKGI